MKNIFKGASAIAAAGAVCLFLASCSTAPPAGPGIPVKELTLLNRTALPFGGASGIAYSEELQKLWIAAGGNQHIYRFDMYGNVEKRLNFTGTDIEGIAFDRGDSTLWTIDEDTKMISHLDRDGNTLATHQISYTTTTNKGPEGIAVGTSHSLYVLNERNPSVLLKFDSMYAATGTYQLGFALDYSDMWYDAPANTFFILSDESGAFFEWSESNGVIARYPLSNTGNEGIAFDRIRQVYYVCNKTTDSLYIYALR